MRVDGFHTLLKPHQAWIVDHLLVPLDLINRLLFVADFLLQLNELLLLLLHLVVLLKFVVAPHCS